MDSISLTGLSIGYRIKGGEKIVADGIDVTRRRNCRGLSASC